MRSSWLGRLSVSRPTPLYMVARLVHPIVLRAEDLRIDPRASNPYTIALMVKNSFGADSYPLSSHGWPPSNEVNKWLNAATILLTTDDSLLVRSVGSHIAALAMSNSNSVVGADGLPHVTWRRHSSGDIRHWLEASALLLTSDEGRALSRSAD